MQKKIDFYFVRHVPVDNPQGIWYGREIPFRVETSEVTDYFKKLAESLPSNPRSTLWLSSPYPRALATARGVHSFLKRGETKPDIRIDEGFVEQKYGVMEGLTREQLKECQGAAGYLKDMWRTAPEGGGESMQMFQTRVAESLERVMLDDAPEGTRSVVVFTHGGVMMAAFAHAIKRRLVDVFQDHKDKLTPSFSYVSRLRLDCAEWNGTLAWSLGDYTRGIPKKAL